MTESPLKPRHYVLIVGGLVFFAGLFFCEAGGKSSGTSFCSNIRVGMSVSEVKARARAEGGRVTMRDGVVSVTFTGFTLFSRHVCFMNIVDDKVAEKWYESFG